MRYAIGILILLFGFVVDLVAGPKIDIKTEINNYVADCEAVKNASVFMPDLENLGEYTDMQYTYQVTCYSRTLGFCSDGLALFVRYDAQTYAEEKERVLASYEFLEEPVMGGSETYELPLTEFEYRGYSMQIVPDEEFIDFGACKSFMILGTNDETHSIVYLYFYDPDLDYIAEVGEDYTSEMTEKVNSAFSWVDKY
jgi:hypothetical protein